MSAARRRARWRNLLILATGAAAGVLVLMLAGAGPGERKQAGDGFIPVGGSISAFSDAAAVSKLDPALRDALRAAARDAGREGIELRVNGGWRSASYQRQLLRRAVQTYGSVEVARQYVKPPGESSHVTGEAVDVGPAEAAGWLSIYGSEYGLCQIYANEPWHFELATTPGGSCPALVSDAAGG